MQERYRTGYVRARPPGFYLGLFFALYGPARFVLDALRVGEAHYLGWTPGQYAALAATLFGAAVLVGVVRRHRQPKAETRTSDG